MALIPESFNVTDNVLGARLVSFKFTAGTSGAAPTSMTRGGDYLGATPITKSTNDYVFNLSNRWYAMEPVGMVTVKQASFAAGGACYGSVQVDTVNNATPTLTISFYKGSDGTAVALATGDIVSFSVILTSERP